MYNTKIEALSITVTVSYASEELVEQLHAYLAQLYWSYAWLLSLLFRFMPISSEDIQEFFQLLTQYFDTIRRHLNIMLSNFLMLHESLIQNVQHLEVTWWSWSIEYLCFMLESNSSVFKWFINFVTNMSNWCVLCFVFYDLLKIF